MEAPLRTLHVDTERTWRGGEQQALYLARGLAARGHVAELVARPAAEFAARGRAAGLLVHEMPLSGELNPRAIWRIARLLRAGRFDLVHAHTSHAHTLAALAARLARVPCVVSRRVDFAIEPGFLGLNRLKYRRGVARYVAISAAVRRVLEAGGVAPERVALVPSGIDPQRLESADPAAARAALGVARETPLVGAVAHFAWHKGLEYLIDAVPRVLERFPTARFALVGAGELQGDLERRAALAAPAGTILFPGFRSDALSFLAAFDVVAAPSLMEGLNTTNLDALALGRPVVAARAGGIPEAVIDGVTGLLVEPRDAAALAAAIVRLLSDRDLAGRLGAAGRKRVYERFTTAAMVEGTLGVYRAVLGSAER